MTVGSRDDAGTAPTLAPTHEIDRGKRPAIALLLIAAGTALRMAYLSQPMRYDEAVTYLYFATRSWLTVFASYRYPNNHILHTALVKISTSALGNAPWAIRIAALVFGVGTLVLTFLVGRRLVGTTAAWLGTAIVAASGPLILYSTNARGYSIVGCATLLIALLLLRLRERPSRIEWVGVVATATLGLWTIPVMLYPAGGLALWFVWSAAVGDTSEPKKDIRRLMLAVAATGVATAIVYSPVVLAQGMQPLVGNQFVTASTWSAFGRDMIAAVPELLKSWSIGIPRFVTVALFVLAIVGEFASRRRRDRRVSLAGALGLWCLLVLLLTHRVPFVRVALFSLPLVALLSGLGIVELLARAVAPARLETTAALTSVVVVGVLGLSVASSRAVLTSTETGTLRNAEEMATFLRTILRPGDRVLAPVPSAAPLSYYFTRAGLDASYLTATPSPTGHVYLVVNNAEGFTIKSPIRGEPFLQQFTKAQLLRAFPDTAAPAAELYQLSASGASGVR